MVRELRRDEQRTRGLTRSFHRSYCTTNAIDGSRTCSAKGTSPSTSQLTLNLIMFLHLGHAYSVQLEAPKDGGVITIGSSWTRGLAIHPVAAVVTFLAFLAAFSQHITISLFASLLAFLAALLTLIAFACDIALLAFVKHEVDDHLAGVRAHATTGPGFWLTFVSLILLLLAGCTVCFARRRSRMANANSYPMSSTKRSFWTRFRRN